MIDIDKLEAAAKAATQGEWRHYDSAVYLPDTAGGFDISYSPNPENNATHIATANPQAVLELITRLREAESELNVCSIEYGDVRDSYLHYKEKCEAAEKDAARYQELIYAVASHFPNESRHETALRYIKQREEPKIESAAMKESA